jgi:hypothetical protein
VHAPMPWSGNMPCPTGPVLREGTVADIAKLANGIKALRNVLPHSQQGVAPKVVGQKSKGTTGGCHHSRQHRQGT